ncbi:hypothetical protein, partial [Mesorhizobium sp. M2D.F.Ca.ET.147.01.1.1]|uniref:hypothetical protein n=1 Tax=Mesorhizobium sp. M2D.F.Ca.ET.147.01.1.1 TaxID=2563934 RepID=UPI0016799FBE
GWRRAEHFGSLAEAGDQRLGDWLGVDARDEPEKQELEQLIVGQGVRTASRKAFAQAVAMAVIVRLKSAQVFGPLSPKTSVR